MTISKSTPPARGAEAVAVHRFAVLVSGTGRHLENLARLAAAGELGGVPALVVSNKAGVAALDRADARRCRGARAGRRQETL